MTQSWRVSVHRTPFIRRLFIQNSGSFGRVPEEKKIYFHEENTVLWLAEEPERVYRFGGLNNYARGGAK